jgi:hypothetical protein
MNLKAIVNIQRQIDTFSDGHQDTVDQAVLATNAIGSMDDCMEKSKESGKSTGLPFRTRRANDQLDALESQLMAQAARALRVRDEIEQIKKNLVIV